ncbi:pitrilysin family protein [Alteromonas sp. ASW11-36]|uniref:Pitrilysin family protein n=1 Tax=Alteromonas arenosi TaxID=3055817 RepID=A0ABT7SV30_9ALTE|nr:pitrilysin family protein [Alteromonas sp. ASW11-36]MDM7860041.1 pitrilysin family protein [Alteromonas sp. ASW11-36]
MIRTIGLVVLVAVTLVGCSTPKGNNADETQQIGIEHTRYQLDNGLTVILHQDTSDPLVHIDVTYHVGSSREVVGRSGFAHFFEHMMFQGSQHVADEQHFAMITEAGGDMNGTTNSDRTNYYQTVPRNHLEKVLWLESDRMGFLLPAVTVEKFENQRDTVKNERAQRVDNQPYGLRSERTSEALYPAGHPYSWPVIGYVEDLERVGVDDLKAFFKRWYGPNNAVLTIGGDIDIDQTKAWVEQYFGPIPRGPEVEDLPKTPVTLTESRYLTLEDNVHLPFLQMTFPTVHARHPDEAPLDVLADILGGGKTSIFYKNLVVSGRTVQAAVSHPCRELACEFQLLALANPGVEPNLNDLYERFHQTFAEFEQRGVQPDDLERVKMSIEARTIFSLQSVASKVSMLAYGQTFAGEPDLVQADIDRYNAVTAEDVMRVYEKYIKNNPAVVLSIVPMQQTQLAVAKPQYEIPARDIPAFDAVQEVAQTPIEDSFDRSQIPPEGKPPVVSVPDFWQTQVLDNVPLLGVTTSETPTVSLSISLEGGPLLDPIDKAGLASMTAMMMNESTTQRSNVELANALSKLGSSVQFSASGRFTTIYVSSISKNLPATLDILYEKLFSPAFLEADFNQLKQRSLQAIQQQMKNPNALASRAQSAILYGPENRVSMPDGGTYTTLSNIQLDDVKAFYAQFYNPAKANIVIVGDIEQSLAVRLLAPLKEWAVANYEIPAYAAFPEHNEGKVFLVDKPGAVQSVVSVVRRSMPYDATGEYFRARLMNFPLGGHFNSRINLNLREDKGYTYGANSYFSGGKTLGIFAAGGDFNAPNTLESIQEILREMSEYKRDGITAQELAFLKSAYTQGDALDYETPAAKARFLRHLLVYELDKSFSEEQLAIIQGITAEEINLVAKALIQPQDMHIIVVGDATSLEPQLAELGREIIRFNASE